MFCFEEVPRWLPDGKTAAVCFSLDDVHPGTSADLYEAGGDLTDGVLGHLEWLLDRHPKLQATLFVTPDWRLLSPLRTHRWPLGRFRTRHATYAAPIRPQGSMRLDRHPQFVEYLRNLPRTDFAVHGLHHVAKGDDITAEFADLASDECRRRVRESLRIFHDAGLKNVPGFAPPRWQLTPELATALAGLEFAFVASARDLTTPVSVEARTAMSGLRGASLIRPEALADYGLVHVTTNFQATTSLDRALAIVEHGGLLAIKAHAVKDVGGHVMADGLDALYRNYLDAVFQVLEERFGDALWWTSMQEVALRCRERLAADEA